MLRRYGKYGSAQSELINWEEPWPCAEMLRTVSDLNEQCLALLAEQAQLRAPAAPPVLRELGELWSQLDGESRRRAAACPYLLVDAGFSDPHRWRWVSGGGVGDREPDAFSPHFTVPGLTKTALQVFSNAWYIVKTQPLGAPLYLGMPAHCASLLRSCTMSQITELAERYSGWLRPRWAGRTKIWSDLLLAAISGDEPTLERVRLHGVQLLATELRALERVYADERG